MAKNKVVIGIVDDRLSAERVVSSLQTAGVPTGDISAIFPDRHGTRDFAHEHHTKAPEGTTTS